MSDTRIYRVDDEASAHLVRAHNSAQAVRHVAKKFKARVATQEDLCELVHNVPVQLAANGKDQDDDEDDE